MPFANAKINLEHLSRELGMNDLTFDENGRCAIFINEEISLHIIYESSSDLLILLFPLLDGLPKNPLVLLSLYEKLLEASRPGNYVTGGGISLSRETELVLLHTTLDMANAVPDALIKILPLYLNALDKLIPECAAICAKDNHYEHNDVFKVNIGTAVRKKIIAGRKKALLETKLREADELLKGNDLKKAIALIDDLFFQLTNIKDSESTPAESDNEDNAETSIYYEAALQHFNSDASRLLAARVHRLRGLWLERREDYDEALASFQNALTTADKYKITLDNETILWIVDLYNAIGRQQRLLGNFRRAVVMFAKAIRQFSQLSSVDRLITLYYLNEISHDEFAQTVLKAEKDLADEKIVGIEHAIAQQVIQAKSIRTALTPAENLQVCTVIASRYFQERQYEWAVYYFKKLTGTHVPMNMPQDIFVKQVKAYAYVGDTRNATQAYKRCMAEQFNVLAFAEYVLFLYAKGDYLDCVVELQDMLARHSQNNQELHFKESDKMLLPKDIRQDFFQNGDFTVDSVSFAYYLLLRCFYNENCFMSKVHGDIYFVDFEKHTVNLKGNLSGHLLLSAIIASVNNAQKQPISSKQNNRTIAGLITEHRDTLEQGADRDQESTVSSVAASQTLFGGSARKVAVPNVVPKVLEHLQIQIEHAKMILRTLRDDEVKLLLRNAFQAKQLAHQPANYCEGLRSALTKVAKQVRVSLTPTQSDERAIDDLLSLLFRKKLTCAIIAENPEVLKTTEFALTFEQLIAIGDVQLDRGIDSAQTQGADPQAAYIPAAISMSGSKP